MILPAWSRTVDPVEEPISIAEAQAQARIPDDESAALLSAYVQTAREEAERQLGRGLFTQTWRLDLPQFAERVQLPMAAPLQSVSTVKYYDGDGTLQTLSSTYYLVDTAAWPGEVARAPGMAWPSVQSERPRPVQITYVVGWSDQASIPERIKQGIRMYVTYLDLDRDGMEVQAEAARRAAEACWTDAVEWGETCVQGA